MPSDGLGIKNDWALWLLVNVTGVPGRLECFCMTAFIAISLTLFCQLLAVLDRNSVEANVAVDETNIGLPLSPISRLELEE